ncbi:helix-turn-helix domain-containing protein [Pseudomonas sp. PB106]|uniref:helix-turn-helix domain-containing protein n=1 Tax=Pseudomonas sp. PB106 TaxID=2494699 RepID=UPI00131DD518|nr:helix-turn-helix domain-containing protein [Pseudomonas sp. PB106]KAE9649529.1 helix-turn-helix domain-containing protein [Pseudomonas sp. PB106]
MKRTTINSNFDELLSAAVLNELDTRIGANASKWLKDNAPVAKSKKLRQAKGAVGRKPTRIQNPFYWFIGAKTEWERYPAFALDIIEGVARLDWHDRPAGQGGKSMPLSVRNLAVILESLPIVTTDTVQDLLQLEERHARRYVKAIELIIPWMLKSRPRSLFNEMESIEPDRQPCKWQDWDVANTPSPKELAQLYYDLRTLTQFKTADEYDEELLYNAPMANVVAFPPRQQHPKKPLVLQMLVDGAGTNAIERETGVSPKTIRKWRDDMLAAQRMLHAA